MSFTGCGWNKVVLGVIASTSYGLISLAMFVHLSLKISLEEKNTESKLANLVAMLRNGIIS